LPDGIVLGAPFKPSFGLSGVTTPVIGSSAVFSRREQR
jgi:hypothetical protein